MPRTVFGYEVLDFLGEGAGSVIYAVAHPQTRQIYALKHVRKRSEKDQRYLDQLDNEADAGRRFSHPSLRKIIAKHDDATLLRRAAEAALVMELIDGRTLEADCPSAHVPLVDCFIQVAEGLAAMHAAGFVHCDLKPANILLSADGRARIIDFGQACPAGTVKQRIQGTPDFMAPEQVRCEPTTFRTDVFNLGATMYWALTGRTLCTLYTLRKGPNSFLIDERTPAPHELDATVPVPLSRLVMECVRVDPLRRPRDMNELLRRLETVRYGMTRSAVAAITA